MNAIQSSAVPSRRHGRAPALGTVDKVEARRQELGAAALRTLAERGYANTSLREIAQNSEFSHGVLHYYFADKTELIIYCVRFYKTRCVRHYDDVDQAATAEELADRFIAALLRTLREDSQEQRLWYDMRSQSLFEPSFRDDVAEIDEVLRDMVWRILGRYARLCDADLVVDADTAYALFDGLFSHAVQDQLAGHPDAGAQLERRVRMLLASLVPPGTA